MEASSIYSTKEYAEPPSLEKTLFPVTDIDRGIVGWDGQDDPRNPQNFSPARKWALLVLISFITFLTPLASSMLSPAVGYMGKDFGVRNETLLSFTVSIYLLGYFGPLFLAPLSEVYGRRVVVSSSNWFFVLWQIGCALAPNIACLTVFRLFTGVGGAGCLTLGAGVISDLFPIEKRALATSIWSVGPTVGPVVGPICGGFIGQQVGWRWVFWVLLIAGGATALAMEFLNRETYAPVLIQRKTTRLAQKLNRPDLQSAYELQRGEKTSISRALKQGFRRPAVLLSKSPIIDLLAIYMALVYALLYLFLTTITTVFITIYGFSTQLSGLAYLGIGIGFFIGLAGVALTNDKVAVKLASRNGGNFQPEMRLPALICYSCILPISFFWYGWTADQHVHWIVPIVGMLPFGIGAVGIYLLILTYAIDCYPEYAASANATLTAARSLLGALLPLAGPKLFGNLGLGWGNSLLGFLALAFVPVPIIFTKYGKLIREKYPVKL
ncbi:hypothetical protein MW887_008343 [Aspergillus wentii]|nr:hypothetical protein MW887_008343 [Aspergillus wentii]